MLARFGQRWLAACIVKLQSPEEGICFGRAMKDFSGLDHNTFFENDINMFIQYTSHRHRTSSETASRSISNWHLTKSGRIRSWIYKDQMIMMYIYA